jgi:hypothetical protein
MRARTKFNKRGGLFWSGVAPAVTVFVVLYAS